MLYAEDTLQQFADAHIVDLFHPVQYRLQQVLRQAFSPLCVHINAGRCEQRLGKVGDDPSSLLRAIAKDLPVTARNHQPAFTSPIPRPGKRAVRSVDAVNGLDLVPLHTLILDQVVELFWGVSDGRVRDANIFVRFPHGQGRMGDMPCSGQEIR